MLKNLENTYVFTQNHLKNHEKINKNKTHRYNSLKSSIIFVCLNALLLTTTGCADKSKISYNYPEPIDDVRDDRVGKILGKDIVLFSNNPQSKSIFQKSNNTTNTNNSTTTENSNNTVKNAPVSSNKILINSYLWQAAVTTLSTMPIIALDSNTGVIVTDWFDDQSVDLRYKVNAVIVGNELRSDALKITVFLDKNTNKAKKINSDGLISGDLSEEKIASKLENIILNKARSNKYHSQSSK